MTKMLAKHEVRIQLATTKYKHTHTAFVEALNKILTENLFKVQDVQELNDSDKVSATWDKHLYGLVDKLNDTETQMTGMKPKDVIKLNQVPLVNRENIILQKIYCLRMYCIAICYNSVKNTTINVKKQRILYGLRRLTD